MTLTDREKKKIDALLVEYQACHRNRNHYDSVRWTIGSIFIATSLALFGISFLKEVRERFIEVILITTFSLLLMIIWYAYSAHVNPYVMASTLRFHEIELELEKWDFDVTLHYSVWKIKQMIRGVWITYFLFLVVLSAWFLRMAIFFQEVQTHILIMIAGLVSAFVVYIIHMEIVNATDMHACTSCNARDQTTVHGKPCLFFHA